MKISPGALSRFKVLELGSTIAGPFCGRLLADFGAQVIKIEDPSGDVIRTMGESFNGKSLYAASLLRNKSTVSIDLRTTEGRLVVKRLASKCDVLIENFRPGTLEKWGLGYDELAKENPRLVMVRISGFGQSGPYSSWPGYGIISEATSGLRSLTGDPDCPPSRMATALTDYVTGLYGAFGALVALLEREMSGQGQVIDAALSESAFSFMEPFVPAYEKLGVVANRAGSKLPGAAPNNLFTTGDGDFIHIAAWHDTLFRRFCSVMEQPDLANDERFKNLPGRVKHSNELDDLIGAWTGSLPLSVLETRLQEAGIPATRIFTIADIFNDRHYKAREALIAVPDMSLGGSVTLAAPVPKLNRTPGKINHTGRDHRQDTRSVLSELGGFTSVEIDALVKLGVVQESKTT